MQKTCKQRTIHIHKRRWWIEHLQIKNHTQKDFVFVITHSDITAQWMHADHSEQQYIMLAILPVMIGCAAPSQSRIRQSRLRVLDFWFSLEGRVLWWLLCLWTCTLALHMRAQFSRCFWLLGPGSWILTDLFIWCDLIWLSGYYYLRTRGSFEGLFSNCAGVFGWTLFLYGCFLDCSSIPESSFLSPACFFPSSGLRLQKYLQNDCIFRCCLQSQVERFEQYTAEYSDDFTVGNPSQEAPCENSQHLDGGAVRR